MNKKQEAELERTRQLAEEGKRASIARRVEEQRVIRAEEKKRERWTQSR